MDEKTEGKKPNVCLTCGVDAPDETAIKHGDQTYCSENCESEHKKKEPNVCEFC